MKTETTKTKKSKKDVASNSETKIKTHPLIKGPRITEKSAIASEKSIYTFNVAKEANKNEVKKAIKMLYGVNAIKISITQIKEKVTNRRGVIGVKQGGKKAVVYLKKGEKITFA
jgi:large subunit ribosomal protein L23